VTKGFPGHGLTQIGNALNPYFPKQAFRNESIYVYIIDILFLLFYYPFIMPGQRFDRPDYSLLPSGKAPKPNPYPGSSTVSNAAPP
jgi:hypothetical protein